MRRLCDHVIAAGQAQLWKNNSRFVNCLLGITYKNTIYPNVTQEILR